MKPRSYMGVNIHSQPGALRWWALTTEGQLRANTLAGIKHLIRQTKGIK